VLARGCDSDDVSDEIGDWPDGVGHEVRTAAIAGGR
jgi:hypothetical protein